METMVNEDGLMNSDPTAEAYNRHPYPNLTYAITHPDRLATLAYLLGLDPPPPDKCRFLDIGCAGGGNLFPMAFGMPESSFVGIDFAARQIEDGQKVIEELGLTNVELVHMDLMDMPEDFGLFDYIVAHGFYSWVPEPVRKKLLEVCSRHLAPNGVAYISYNTYPGWNFIRTAREAMFYNSRNADTPEERASKGREMFYFLTKAVSEDESSYGSFLHNYAEAMEEKVAKSPAGDSSLLLHDELAEINDPFYFHEFMEEASQHGLQYLVEAEFSDTVPTNLPPETVKDLRKMVRNIIETEQYMDFVNNKTFRRTLLCHKDQNVDRILHPERVSRFLLSSRAKPVSDEPDLHTLSVEKFKAPDGAVFSTNHPLSKAALVYLGQSEPASIPFDEVVRQAAKLLNLDPETDLSEESLMVAANVLQAYSYSGYLMQLRLFVSPFVTEISERPLASPISHWQAENAIYVSNIYHERVELEDLSRFVLSQLDGKTTRDEIYQQLLDLYKSGKFKIRLKGKKRLKRKKVPAFVAEDLDSRLKAIAKSSLLIA